MERAYIIKLHGEPSTVTTADPRDPAAFEEVCQNLENSDLRYVLCRDYDTGKYLIVSGDGTAPGDEYTATIMEDNPPHIQVLYTDFCSWQRENLSMFPSTCWVSILGSLVAYNKHFLNNFPAKLVDVQEVEAYHARGKLGSRILST